VAVRNLLRLAELTSSEHFRERAERALTTFNGILSEAPAYLSDMLLGVDFALDTPKEIVIVTPHSRSEAEPLLEQLRRRFVPNRILVVAPQGAALAAAQKLIPLVENKIAQDGRATAYVCEKRVCKLPTTDPEVFAGQITARPPALDPAGDAMRR
jgi:uncharacterized protein YyaL (SSP411 family)